MPGLILPADRSGAATHVVQEGDPEEWVTQVNSCLPGRFTLSPQAMAWRRPCHNCKRCEHQPICQCWFCRRKAMHRSPICDSCCMQVFRSIDTESCVGFPTTNAEAYNRGLISSALPCPQLPCVLMCKIRWRQPCADLALRIAYAVPNGKVVDKSIQHAYIHAIRKVQHPNHLHVRSPIMSS